MTPTLLFLSSLLPTPAGQLFRPDPAADSYFKVEAKGILKVDIDPNSKKVRSAQFTCGQFTVFGHIHLVLPDKKEMHDLATQLHGQSVIITGRAHLEEEPPMGRLPLPGRFFLFAETLSAAAKKTKE